jgi:hypothetical protein
MTVVMSSLPQIVFVRVNNEGPSPQISGLHVGQVVTIPARFSFALDVSQITAMSTAQAPRLFTGRRASMAHWTSYMVMVACAGAAFPSQITCLVNVEPVLSRGQFAKCGNQAAALLLGHHNALPDNHISVKDGDRHLLKEPKN